MSALKSTPVFLSNYQLNTDKDFLVRRLVYFDKINNDNFVFFVFYTCNTEITHQENGL